MSTKPFTITLTRISTETDEEYAERCQDIDNYVCSKITQVHIDHFTRVAQDAAVLPEHQSTKERNTHFAGSADLIWKEMIADGDVEIPATEGDLLYMIQDYCSSTDKAQEFEQDMKKILAQRVYDLFIHDRMHTATSDLQHAASRSEAEEYVNSIPDMTAWPKESD